MSERIPVAVLGATGSVGQRFVSLLADHPWFELRAVTASERSAGRAYRGAVSWMQPCNLPHSVGGLIVGRTEPDAAAGCRIAFSALDSDVAGDAEVAFAKAGMLVVSNSKNHRMDADVPLVVPEVNGDHLPLVSAQGYGEGRIITNPNCSTIGLVMALKPLVDAFGVSAVHVVTMQAVSGAGIPGVPGMQVVDNLIPYIPGEEDKLESETRKILGRLEGDRIVDADVTVSAACNRVPVIDGHTECVSVKLRGKASAADLVAAWRSCESEPQRLDLPSAPRPTIHVLEADDAPQPRLHRDLGNGMAVSIGRLRPCPLFDWKFVTLSHNTLRGAAGGSILLAELAVKRGLAK
ncbi:aspartate-semialdehyde dehydrogenase [bacterium]|nr:aspartate-semialdehyde dehydrogenase [bacterium]